MNKKCLLLLLIAGLFGFRCFSQGRHRPIDTIEYSSLPDTLKTILAEQSASLLEKDSLTGRRIYFIRGRRHEYDYRFYLRGGKLTGYYEYHRVCPNCYAGSVQAALNTAVLYCCKDPSHNPHETANTKNEMLAIQGSKHCSKIGICFFE